MLDGRPQEEQFVILLRAYAMKNLLSCFIRFNSRSFDSAADGTATLGRSLLNPANSYFQRLGGKQADHFASGDFLGHDKAERLVSAHEGSGHMVQFLPLGTLLNFLWEMRQAFDCFPLSSE